MPISAVLMQWPCGCPWVMSSATDIAEMISERRISVAATKRAAGGPRIIGWADGSQQTIDGMASLLRAEFGAVYLLAGQIGNLPHGTRKSIGHKELSAAAYSSRPHQ